MQGGTVRVAVAGFLAIVILSALGPSMAAAVEAAEDQPPSAAPVEPETPPAPPPPEPSQAKPPELPESAPPEAATPEPTPKAKPETTPKPRATAKPAPTPKPKPKPKPKPTPVTQLPGQGPGRQAPGDPKPVRPAEPPAAPGLPDPGADAPPGTVFKPPSGGAGSGPTEPPVKADPSPSRVQLVVAGATVSGIAAVAGWLVLGGRRRERPRERPSAGVPRPPATTVTTADGMELDLEVVINRPDGPVPRYAGRVPGTASTTLWEDEDDRPRWLRRIDEQGPARPRPSRSAIGLDDRLGD